MKKTLYVAMSIFLVLFVFASCTNDSGSPGFSGNAEAVANVLKPADLVNDVLKPNTKGVDIEYRIINEATRSTAEMTITTISFGVLGFFFIDYGKNTAIEKARQLLHARR